MISSLLTLGKKWEMGEGAVSEVQLFRVSIEIHIHLARLYLESPISLDFPPSDYGRLVFKMALLVSTVKISIATISTQGGKDFLWAAPASIKCNDVNFGFFNGRLPSDFKQLSRVEISKIELYSVSEI